MRKADFTRSYLLFRCSEENIPINTQSRPTVSPGSAVCVSAGVHVRPPPGTIRDATAWSLLGSISASLDHGGSPLERVHVSIIVLVTKALTCTCTGEDTDVTSWNRQDQSFNEAEDKTRKSAEVQRSPEDKREGRRSHR